MWIFRKQQKNEEGEGTQKSEAEVTHLAPVRENPALATWGPQTVKCQHLMQMFPPKLESSVSEDIEDIN